MKHKLLDIIKDIGLEKYQLNPQFSYFSILEEAIKLALNDLDKYVLVKENSYLASKLYEYLSNFYHEDDLVLYIPEESLRHEAIIASFDNKVNRLKALYNILHHKPKIIITTGYGLVRNLPKKADLKLKSFELRLGQCLNRNDVIKCLIELGYQKTLKIDVPLSFAYRGSILDVYSINYDHPVRIEFFGDEIDSIRFFDVETAKSIKSVDKVTIALANDVYFNDLEKEILSKELKDKTEFESDLNFILDNQTPSHLYVYRSYLENDHLLDYLLDYQLYLSDPKTVKDNLENILKDNINYIQEMASEHKLPLKYDQMGQLDQELKKVSVFKTNNFQNNQADIESLGFDQGSIDTILKFVYQHLSDKKVIFYLEKTKLEELKHKLELQNYVYNTQETLKKGLNLWQGSLNQGFEIKELDIIVFSAKELYNQKSIVSKYHQNYQEALVINNYSELSKGDYVVHTNYGIGQYMGLVAKEINGIKKDYLLISYKGNDQLSVPLSQFSLVRKYVSKDSFKPKLNKLGSNAWSETKKKVSENINGIAQYLINLYQARKQKKGFKFEADDDTQKAFEADFVYKLTSDQAQAIKDVKADMEAEMIMDRLICGDVGFGKTEVAMRAAMKAVLSLKQVAFLCPTTVLSLQHYNTFKKRFKDYGIIVRVLNRYVSDKDQKLIIQELKQGKVDILIGSHRILSNDVIFKDLGLLIIDEEQRFGVNHKEKIKVLKDTIDVLSLSATPIPRTLQMSLLGIRSLSILNKPPLNRYPVQTYVVEKNEALIKEAISKELTRKGQVFYLCNDINSFDIIAFKLKQMIEGVRIGMVHGKMLREHIEDVMADFYHGHIDILICTTIIETGIDVANANLVLVENAQNFGLSQLYQIKGRVGRSDRLASAYFMVPKQKQLNEDSTKRLEAIKEFASLGSGYKIALRDLAIRGAGDLLGESQSGFIDSVGFDLYMSMLEESIKEKQGLLNPKPKKTHNINIESYIPNNFSDNDFEKLDIYQKLDKIQTRSQLKQYLDELIDTFGKLPKEVASLIDKKLLELFIDHNYLDSFKVVNNYYHLELSKQISENIDGLKLFSYCDTLSKDLKISYKNQKINFSINITQDNFQKIITLIENIQRFQKETWL